MRAFPAFTYFKSHAWRGSPFWQLWPEPPNQKLAFSTLRPESLTHPSGDGGCLLATQLYLSVFTCPTASLNLPSDAGESLPARQPYLFYPTADLPFRLYLSDTASLDLPSDAGESLPARQLYLFEPVAQRGLPVRHGDLETTVGRRQEPLGQQPYLFLLDEAYPSDTATLKPVGRRREPTGQSNLSFPFCGQQSLPNHAAGWLRGLPTT